MEEIIRTVLARRGGYGEMMQYAPTIRGFSVTFRPHSSAECLEVGVVHSEIYAFLFEKIQDLQEQIARLEESTQCGKCGLTMSDCVC